MRTAALKDTGAIQRFYEGYAQREVDRLDRQPVEYYVTTRYLTEHLPSHGSVLENGDETDSLPSEDVFRSYYSMPEELYDVSSQPSYLSSSAHILYIGEKDRDC